MTTFSFDPDLKVGVIFEVAGSSVKIALHHEVLELTKSFGGRNYPIGQIGSILKIHLGRRLIFASVSMLRLQTDEEASTLAQTDEFRALGPETRIIEADLLGEGSWNRDEEKLTFRRGVVSYPLPLQPVLLMTQEEVETLFRSAEHVSDSGSKRHIQIGKYGFTSGVLCRADVDKLFGQHCAILGSTGSGKSSAVAAILHALLDIRFSDDRPTKPRIVLIDPHGEYRSAFDGQCAYYRAYNVFGEDEGVATDLNLPYWLMSGDEFRSLIVGKTEFEATTRANIVYKALTHARMVEAGLIESALQDIPAELPEGNSHCDEPIPVEGVNPEDIASFDRDKPRPFKLSEFRAHIEQRQAMRLLKNGWERVTASEWEKNFASLLSKLRVLESDTRISFLMSEHSDESPTLNQILSQFVSVNDEGTDCIKIVDISGLPTEVAGPLAGAMARLLFQYKLFENRAERESDPLLLVCEEAHRYVPDKGEAQYSVAQSAVKRIAREGRKYGLGLMLVSQRPSDVDGTVISQCNSWLVLRLSNSSDQSHVSRFLPDSLSGMTRSLSSLPRQEALFVGEAAAIPARVKLNTLTPEQLPDSNDISFADGWSREPDNIATIGNVVDRMTS